MDDKDKQIQDLKNELSQEIAVKKSEVVLNKQRLEEIHKLQLHLETLQEINEDYSKRIAKLETMLKTIHQHIDIINGSIWSLKIK